MKTYSETDEPTKLWLVSIFLLTCMDMFSSVNVKTNVRWIVHVIRKFMMKEVLLADLTCNITLGIGKARVERLDGPFLECGSDCRCSMKCGNRIAQKGSKHAIEVGCLSCFVHVFVIDIMLSLFDVYTHFK